MKGVDLGAYVCKDMRLLGLLLTPSIISISPELGQFRPKDQSIVRSASKSKLIWYEFDAFQELLLTRWPSPTNTSWHVCNICNEQAMCPGFLRTDSHTLSSWPRSV